MIPSEASQVQMGLMDRLREETKPLHDAAENHALQRDLAKGRLDLSLYVAYLEQILLVHRALESGLRTLRERDPTVASIIDDEQFQEPYLEADLRHFGVEMAPGKALEATAGLVANLENDALSQPLALLGYHYVLEGSNNGGRFIARNVRQAYALTDEGVRYLDPYGDRQREVWMAFKEAMSQARFSPADQDAMVDRAKVMFGGIAAIGDELLGRAVEGASVVG